MPGPDALQLVGLLECFPAAEHVDIRWQLMVADTDDKLIPTIEPITSLSRVRWLEIGMNLPTGFESPDHLPRELGMIFKHLRFPGVVELDIRLFDDMLGNQRVGKYFEGLTEALGGMDFPALDTFYLAFDFVITGLPVEDVWVRLPRIPFSMAIADI
jgi:hypothetical protein